MNILSIDRNEETGLVTVTFNPELVLEAKTFIKELTRSDEDHSGGCDHCHCHSHDATHDQGHDHTGDTGHEGDYDETPHDEYSVKAYVNEESFELQIEIFDQAGMNVYPADVYTRISDQHGWEVEISDYSLALMNTDGTPVFSQDASELDVVTYLPNGHEVWNSISLRGME